MNRDKTESDMIKMVNVQRDFEEIGRYIISEFYSMYDITKPGKYKLEITVEEYAKIEQHLLQKYRVEAQKLLRLSKMSKEDILAGKASFEIYKLICILQASFLSKKDVIKQQEEETKKQEIEFKTKKKLKERNERIKKLLTGISLSGLVVIGGLAVRDGIIDYQADKEVTESIGYLVSEEENDKRNIVEQNIYRSSFDEKGKEVYDINIQGLARDIITLCKRNPELFDITIYNVYSNLDDNQIGVMDSVIENLRNMAIEDESLGFILSKIGNSRVFLDYLVNRGFLNPNSDDYYTILNDIELYIETKGRGAQKFELLPDVSKNRLQGLLKNFKENRDNLYAEYKDDLDRMDDDGYGTR